MAVALVPREDNAFANDNPPPGRNAVLARYRQLREISKKHHHDILKLISGDAMLQQARRLGLVQGRTPILDDMEEMPRHLHGTARPFAGNLSLCQVGAASAGLRRGAHARGDARGALMWMKRTYPHIPFERYADDAICHCTSAEEAQREPLDSHGSRCSAFSMT
jgi:hypothetical protein